MMLMSAVEVQGFVHAWVEEFNSWKHACMLFVVHFFASWNYCNTHPEPTANEGEDNQKVCLVKKKPIDPGCDRAYIYLDPSLCT